MQLSPPAVPLASLTGHLRGVGHGVIEADGVCELAGVALSELRALEPSWDDLPPDDHLRDGGRYRRRRHACYLIEPGGPIVPVAQRPHWQPVEYNALHGGIERWFAPIVPPLAHASAWHRLLQGLASVAAEARAVPRWHVEAHQFRIDTSDGIGRPTPEGAHRDGVDFVAVILVARCGIKGGETRVFDAQGPSGLRFTLTRPWTLLMLDDAKVIHETTPIQPLDADTAGWRDTLVITFRASGFQGPVPG